MSYTLKLPNGAEIACNTLGELQAALDDLGTDVLIPVDRVSSLLQGQTTLNQKLDDLRAATHMSLKAMTTELTRIGETTKEREARQGRALYGETTPTDDIEQQLAHERDNVKQLVKEVGFWKRQASKMAVRVQRVEGRKATPPAKKGRKK